MIKQLKQLKLKQTVKFITGIHKNEIGIIVAMHKDKSRVQVADKENPGIPKFHIRERFSITLDAKTQKKIKIKRKDNGFIHASNIKVINK